MFSLSSFQKKKEFEKFHDNLKKAKDFTRQKIELNKGKPIVVLIGMMGVGKSSLACSLLNRSLTIQGKGISKYLVGEGVGLGLDACTTIPSIAYNQKENWNLADTPGFEDNRNNEQEVANSIITDNLFEINPNYNQEYKIILLITSYDFKTNRCQKLIDSFWRLRKMFPNYNEIKHTFGIVITKGNNEYESQDYIDFFNEIFSNTLYKTTEMKEVSQFLNKYKENIFIFPEPKDDVGKSYNFKDHSRLLAFLKTNYVKNPKHQIALSECAELSLKDSYIAYKKDVLNIVDEICQKISCQYQNETKSNNIQQWILNIQMLKNSQIENLKDFENAVKKHIPNNTIYNNDFQKFTEFYLFDDMITKILPSYKDIEYIYQNIVKWSDTSIGELTRKYQKARTIEHTEYLKQKKKEEEEKLKKIEEENRRKEEERIKRERDLQKQAEEGRRLQEQSQREREELERQKRSMMVRYYGG